MKQLIEIKIEVFSREDGKMEVCVRAIVDGKSSLPLEDLVQKILSNLN